MQRSMNTALAALGRVAARGSRFAPVRPEPAASFVTSGACGTAHATGEDGHVCFWRRELEAEARRLGLDLA
jgi:hypothetical protein